jgi:dihydrodipicolinate synthase/N-acetylneuraminate lyase
MALTQSERDRAIRITVDQCKGKVPVMCGVMDTSTRRVIDNIKRMEDMGGDCAVVTSIFYARHTSQAETVRHFEQIAKETTADLVLYNIPAFTGLKLEPATVLKICAIDKVKAYKDTTGAFADFLKVLRELEKTDVSVLQGMNPYFVTSVLLGADGTVPAAAPLFPEIYVEAYEAGVKGDVELCKKYDVLLGAIGKMLAMSKNLTAVNKFAIATLGYTDKRVIAPQDTISPEEEENVLRQMEVIRQMHSQLKASL